MVAADQGVAWWIPRVMAHYLETEPHNTTLARTAGARAVAAAAQHERSTSWETA
jgi:hypothetical protein